MLRKRISGFTLMEAMIVLAIMTAVIIAVPPIFNRLGRQGVGHAADQLRSDLQLARMLAINRKQPCAIETNIPQGDQYRNTGNRQVVRLDGYRGGVRFLEEGPDGSDSSGRIVFNRQGMSASALPSDLFLADKAEQSIYRLRVMLPGGISISRWSGSRWQ